MLIHLDGNYIGGSDFAGNSPAAKFFLGAIEQNWWVKSTDIVENRPFRGFKGQNHEGRQVDFEQENYLQINFTKGFLDKITDLHGGKSVDFLAPDEEVLKPESLLARAARLLSAAFFRPSAAPAALVLKDKTSAETLVGHFTSSLQSITKHDMQTLAQEYERRVDLIALGKPMSPDETKIVATSLHTLSASFEKANTKALTALSETALIGMEVVKTRIEMRIEPFSRREPT